MFIPQFYCPECKEHDYGSHDPNICKQYMANGFRRCRGISNKFRLKLRAYNLFKEEDYTQYVPEWVDLIDDYFVDVFKHGSGPEEVVIPINRLLALPFNAELNSLLCNLIRLGGVEALLNYGNNL